MTLPVVLAFGGNALLPDPDSPREEEVRAKAFAWALLLVMPSEAGMVLLHGNGPQVGMILLRIEKRIVPWYPAVYLGVCEVIEAVRQFKIE